MAERRFLYSLKGKKSWRLRECADRVALAAVKVNLKSLAAEARFNRREAAKLTGEDKWRLNHHRTFDLRREARATQWLYAMMRGRSKRQIEPVATKLCGYDIRWFRTRVTSKAKRLGFEVTGWDQWLAE